MAWGTGFKVGPMRDNRARGLADTMSQNGVGVGGTGGLSTIPGHMQAYTPSQPQSFLQRVKGQVAAAPPPAPVAPPMNLSTTTQPPEWYTQLMAKTPQQLMTENQAQQAAAPGDWYSTSGSQYSNPSYRPYSGGETDLTGGPFGGMNDSMLINTYAQMSSGDPRRAGLGNALVKKYGSMSELNRMISQYSAGGSGYNPEDMSRAYQAANMAGGTFYNPSLNPGAGAVPPTSGPSPVQNWLGNWWDHPYAGGGATTNPVNPPITPPPSYTGPAATTSPVNPIAPPRKNY